MQMNEMVWSCDATMADWHIAAARACGRDKSGPYALRRWGLTRPRRRVQPCAAAMCQPVRPWLTFQCSYYNDQKGLPKLM